MKKILFLLTLITNIQFSNATSPDEGMWLPMLVNRLNADDITKHGYKLSTNEIYDINHSSMKDAIVSLGFCTAEIISENGLLLTNHHCAFDAIQTHSTVQHNYLDDGFWAKNYSEELSIPGQTASILERMDDVTKKVLEGVTDEMSYTDRYKKIKDNSKIIEKEASANGKYKALVKDMFNGNEYYLFVYVVYKDVRLVGAPPSSVGKFGGDTDNWMWPRHTGDFSLMRIYTAKDGSPADFSQENIPFKPKYSFPVSIKGYKEGDFAMVFGFPGRTNRYITASAMAVNLNYLNPAMITLFQTKLETWKTNMDKDEKTRIQYASKYANLANSWKYYIGQNKGLEKLHSLSERQKQEDDFQKWTEASNETKKRYGNILSTLKQTYNENTESLLMATYAQLAGFGSEAGVFSTSVAPLASLLEKPEERKADIDKLITELKIQAKELYKDYNEEVDKQVFAKLLLKYITAFPKEKLPPLVAEILNKNGKTVEEKVIKYVDAFYKKSIFSSENKFNAFIASPKLKVLQNDPSIKFFSALNRYLGESVYPTIQKNNPVIELQKRLYLEALMKYKKDAKFYPDANSTLRLSYGNVMSYDPADALHYNFFTTTDGINEKYKAKDQEFDVPQRLLDLIEKKDFGRYAENGAIRVSFLTNNDITGGNSGSPVINGDGEIIGVAYDGNWEAMTGDMVFDAKLKRTICCDIRYVLFIIDKYAGAQNIINELKIKN